MKKLKLASTLLLISCLLFSFTTINESDLKKGKNMYLPATCDEPIHFEIESQEPCNAFEVNPDNGKLSLLDSYSSGLCGNFDDSNNDRKIKIRYNVTSADGTREGHFIILDLEGEE